MSGLERIRSRAQACGTSATGTPIQNRLLASLPKTEIAEITPYLRRVAVDVGTVFHEPDQNIKMAYFPTTGAVSLMAVMRGQRTAEVGLIGNEGVLGIPIILGSPKSTRRAVAQAAVSALSLPAKDFKYAFDHLPAFRERLLRYVRAQIVVASQIAACNGVHGLEQRLARCLLMCHDRAPGERLPFTHELLAEILGVKRTTITEVARKMQKAGLIDYSRGRITIINRKALERASCECYQIIREKYSDLWENQSQVWPIIRKPSKNNALDLSRQTRRRDNSVSMAKHSDSKHS